jgi:serine/threonine protein kinase
MDAEARFLEIDIMRNLNHVQIVKLIDVYKDDEDRPCFTMEKYDSSLDNDLKILQLDEPEIKRIFTMICIPLFYIHKN